jgi:hypothetical protein
MSGSPRTVGMRSRLILLIAISNGADGRECRSLLQQGSGVYDFRISGKARPSGAVVTRAGFGSEAGELGRFQRERIPQCGRHIPEAAVAVSSQTSSCPN